MAFPRLEATPTCDIHLLMSLPTKPFEMVLWFVSDAFNRVNVAGHTDTTVTGFGGAGAVAQVVVFGSGPGALLHFTPVKVGDVIGRITHVAGPAGRRVTHELLVRVRVHEKIDAFWLGNNQITLQGRPAPTFFGPANYVVSVYAKFSDGTLGDITSHPYLDFSSRDTSVAELTVPAAEGRLKGGDPGDTHIDVKHGTVTQSVAVHVDQSDVIPTTPGGSDFTIRDRPILERIHGSASIREARNILILAEGYKAAEEPEFRRRAQEATARLVSAPSHSPFGHVQGALNVWIAFEESKERGITVGPNVTADGTPIPSTRGPDSKPTTATNYDLSQLVERVGLPTAARLADPGLANLAAAKQTWTTQFPAIFDSNKLEQAIFDGWRRQLVNAVLQAKNSRYGLIYGARTGERQSTTTPARAVTAFDVPTEGHHLIGWDTRRANPDRTHFDFFDIYLRSLKNPKVAPTDPDFDVGALWGFLGGPHVPGQNLVPGRDRGLVCILVNDEAFGGARIPPSGPIGMAVGANLKYTLQPIASSPAVDHDPTVQSVPVEYVTATLSHELGHALAFRLGDEYEGRSSLPAADVDAVAEIEDFTNLTHDGRVRRATPPIIDTSKIKWTWHRIDFASPLAADVAIAAGSTTVVVTIRLPIGMTPIAQPITMGRWALVGVLGGLGDPEGDVFLRNPDLNPHRRGSTAALLGPFTITAVDTTLNTVTLKLKSGQIPAAITLPERSVLYKPKFVRATAQVLSVIHPRVLGDIATNGPFDARVPRNTACGVQQSGPRQPRAIAGVTYPAQQHTVIGLYEGGGEYTCDVHRPTGMCKMRSPGTGTFNPATGVLVSFKEDDNHFCFVCKYAIVDAVDPSRHDLVDREYPTVKAP